MQQWHAGDMQAAAGTQFGICVRRVRQRFTNVTDTLHRPPCRLAECITCSLCYVPKSTYTMLHYAARGAFKPCGAAQYSTVQSCIHLAWVVQVCEYHTVQCVI
jgi:hypothetical protein